MYWGTVGEVYVEEALLSPLGLFSHGGASIDGEMSYLIFSKDNKFLVELKKSELKNIGKIYSIYLRENKLKRILVNG